MSGKTSLTLYFSFFTFLFASPKYLFCYVTLKSFSSFSPPNKNLLVIQLKSHQTCTLILIKLIFLSVFFYYFQRYLLSAYFVTTSQDKTIDRHSPLSLEGQTIPFILSGLTISLLDIYSVEMSADTHLKIVQEHS